MKQRFLALLAALCLLGTSLTVSAAPAAGSGEEALQTVLALGIMQGDEKGDLTLDQPVTRAQFVTMMTRVSAYKDSISPDGSGYSLFKDVKSSHWASEYIRVALQEGWMIGYTDGTFRPEGIITLEEACTTLLRLLGYDSSALAGSYPAAQLNKAYTIGLRDDLDAVRGQPMKRRECVQLFYNLLTAKTAAGQVYGTVLGYTVTNGRVNYTAVVQKELSGPYVCGGEGLSFTPLTVYRDGDRVSSADLRQDDVYYYHEGLRTAWIYTKQVTGKIDALTPSAISPTAVTVGGKTYTIGSSSVTYRLSALGGGKVGDMVTLLLGMEDEVAGVRTGDEVEKLYYGVVSGCAKQVTTDGAAAVETALTMVCTDGVTRTFTVAKDIEYTTGRLASVSLAGDSVTVRILSERYLEGTVDRDATKLGNYPFAENIEILDTTNEGDGVAVEPESLAGRTLNSLSVRQYVLNETGEISHLILNDVTGEIWTCVYMTDVMNLSAGMNINVNYSYLLNGNPAILRSSGTAYPVEEGGVAIRYTKEGTVKSMRQMSSVKLTNLGVQTALADYRTFALADDVQVYLQKGEDYYLTKLSAVNAEDYDLTGWYSTGNGTSVGVIRIMIARAK